MLLNLPNDHGGRDSGGNIKCTKECFLEEVTNCNESNEDFESTTDNDYDENGSGMKSLWSLWIYFKCKYISNCDDQYIFFL